MISAATAQSVVAAGYFLSQYLSVNAALLLISHQHTIQ
jgi:hypothetical protein